MAEIFEGGATQAKNVDTWVNAQGESTEAAKVLAEQTEATAEAIRNGTKKELLEMYVDLLKFAMPSKTDVNFPELTVGEKYRNKGLLAVVEDNSSDMRMLFNQPDKGNDYRLLSYATVYKNFKAVGMDANYLPMGAKVRVENGEVTVSYTDKSGTTHIATSELLPWSTAEAAEAKYQEILAKERTEQAAAIEAAGGPQITPEVKAILDEPTPGVERPAETKPTTLERVDERSEYERRLDQKVDEFAARHPSLTEQFPPNSDNEHIGYNTMGDSATYVASFKTPDGEYVSINVRAENKDPEKREQMLEAALDEELARWDKKLSRSERPAPTAESVDERDEALEKEWLEKVKPSIQQLETMFPGFKIKIRDASFRKRKDKPTDEADPFPNYGKHGKTVEIHYGPKKYDYISYQILVPKEANSYYDSAVSITKDVDPSLSVTWGTVERGPSETVIDKLTGEVDQLYKEKVGEQLITEGIGKLDELSVAQQLYYLEWFVLTHLEVAEKNPNSLNAQEKKMLTDLYETPVVMEVSEQWYLELSQRTDLDAASRARLEQVKVKIQKLQALRAAQAVEPAPTTPEAVQRAADALGLSTRLSPLDITQGLSVERNRASEKIYYLMNEAYGTSPGSYLTLEKEEYPTIQADGSMAWDLRLAPIDDHTFTIAIRGSLPAIDPAKVQAYCDTQAANGLSYTASTLAKYLLYRNANIEILDQIQSFATDPALQEAYHAYLEKQSASQPPAVPASGTDQLPTDGYQALSSIALDDEQPISGNVKLTCEVDKTIFEGQLKDNVPNGLGTLTLADGTKLGPMNFVDGKATANLADGKTKEVTWDSVSGTFLIDPAK